MKYKVVAAGCIFLQSLLYFLSVFFYLKHISTSTAISAMNFYRTMKNVKDRRATANELRACIYDWCHSLCIFRYFCYIRSGYVFFRNFFFFFLFVGVCRSCNICRSNANARKTRQKSIKRKMNPFALNKSHQMHSFFSFFLF